MIKFFRPLDIPAFILSLGVLILITVVVYRKSGDRIDVVIRVQEKEWVYQLDQDRRIPVKGVLGETVIVIRSHEVLIESSPCKNQNCVLSGHLKRASQWSACLPNQVFVRLEGHHEPETDAIAF